MRIDLLEAFGLDPNVIAILKQKYGAQLLPIQERAFKEHQILNGGNFLLSAVLGKSEALAQWLRAKMIREDKRPVELRQGVFFDGKIPLPGVQQRHHRRRGLVPSQVRTGSGPVRGFGQPVGGAAVSN